MDAILVNNDYEKALIVLGLRGLASEEAQKAVAYLNAGVVDKGSDSLDRSKSATALADRIDA